SYIPKKNSGSAGKPGKAAQAVTQEKSAQTTITNYYVTMSGTSMATPMVAGTAALLLEQNPWTPDEVKRQLMSTALNLGFAVNEQGAGEVNINLY
ncbi:S8 family serine peptidase, partial [Thermincola ferriacetica]